MTIAFGAIGAKSAGGTTSVSVAYPASVGAGDYLILANCGWPASAGVNALSGWTVDQQSGGTGSSVDAHDTTIAAFRKEAAGGETGTVAVGRGGTPSGQLGVMARYTRTGSAWDTIVSVSGNDSTHGANRSITTGTVDLAPGDWLVIAVAVDTDTSLTITSPTLTATGITFGTVNRRTSGAGVTTGNDGNVELFDAEVTAGSGTVAVTFAFTTATSQCGPARFTRLREVAGGPTDYAAAGTVAAVADEAGTVTAGFASAGAVAAVSALAGAVLLATSGAGTVAGTSAVTGSAVVGRPAAGSVAATSTVTGDAAKVSGASGTVAASTGTAGAVTATLGATGSVAGSSTVTGTVTAPKVAAGTAAATSTVTGTVTAPKAAAGTITATTATTGSVTARLGTIAVTAVFSTVTGDPTGILGVTGTSTATSTVAGSASVVGGAQNYPAVGTASSTTSAFGSPVAVHPVTGTVAASTTASGTITARLGSAGTTAGTSTVTGAVTAIRPATGNVAAVSSVTGAPNQAHNATGATKATSDTTGDPTAALATTGTIEAVTATTGTTAGDNDGTPVLEPELNVTLPQARLALTFPTAELTVTIGRPALALTIPTTRMEVPAMGLHVGDTAPRFTAALTTGTAKTPVNLTGATVEVHLRKPDRTAVDLPATVDAPATDGKVTGGPWGSILSVSGSWTSEVEVTYSDGSVQTFGPKSFYVEPQIG